MYLTASSVGCSTPVKVRLSESGSQIEISVTGTLAGEPCTMQHLTLFGYVQIGSIGQRQVTGKMFHLMSEDAPRSVVRDPSRGSCQG